MMLNFSYQCKKVFNVQHCTATGLSGDIDLAYIDKSKIHDIAKEESFYPKKSQKIILNGSIPF